MRKAGFCVLVCTFVSSTALARADIAAIHASALPQETAVLAVLDDVKQIEPFSQAWASNWQYSIPKDEVATRLGKDLGFLTLALKNHPENLELALLTGLVARYAYNLDIDGSFDAAMSALGQAAKLAPEDLRAPWFRAALECQTRELAAGAKEFLAIEVGHTWDSLPIAFWHDYVNCATIDNLPEHALRAIDRLKRLHAGEAAGFSTAVDINRKRIVPYDPKKDYQPKDVWEGENVGDVTVFTSTLCGVRLHARGDWEVDRVSFDNGTCVANFCTGPYKATTSSLRPCILLLARPPKEGESLLDFSKLFLKDALFLPDDLLMCPVSDCVAMKGIQRGMYKKNGDGHGRVLTFERDQPKFPGLVFESPLELPKPDGSGGGPKYYRPSQTQERIPGKLYYLVLLDTAASIEEPAMKDFGFFLQNLTVE
jgi:hypothetical protein